MKIFLLFFVVCSIEAQNSFQLQYLGDSLSIEEATNRELCETKYCLLDAKYLFSGSTQNKSVRPCDDFEEFALGTFVKYESVNDRYPVAGFINDFLADFIHRLKRVLAKHVNVNDSRLSKEIKRFFAKCVNSKYIKKNGVREAREYARSIGLKFYPETNDKDFNLKDYIEQGLTNSLFVLFFIDLGYFDDEKPSDLSMRFEDDKFKSLEKELEGYESILYDMNQIFRNSSYSKEFTKDFKEIKDKQTDFFNRLKNVFLSVKEENSSKLMTIEELNNSTLPLNLNWLTIINNLLITKINSTAQIFVARPQSISRIAEFLAETDKNVIADYMVVNFLTNVHVGILVYDEIKNSNGKRGMKRPPDRSLECVITIINIFHFPTDDLFLKRYFDKESEDSLKQFINETIEFALVKLRVKNCWGEEVFEDLTERLQSMKVIIGFSDELVGQDLLEELYGSLDFDQSFIKVQHEIYLLDRKLKREQKNILLFKLSAKSTLNFLYRPNDNIMFISSQFLNYPFYHKHRPRFFNTATVSSFIFKSLANDLSKYLNDKYKIKDFSVFDLFSTGYEFYESWLESGGEEMNLGANRLTNRQLYWVAAARIIYVKFNSENLEFGYGKNFHKLLSRIPEFNEAFGCKMNK